MDEQKQAIFELLKYKPSIEAEPIHECNGRLILVTGGWRAGKSETGEHELLGRLKVGGLYWFIGPTYDDTIDEFNYAVRDAGKMGTLSRASKNKVGARRIELGRGTVIETRSAADPERVSRQAPDGVVVCEAGRLSYEAFLRLRGRLVEKDAWMVLEGTLEASQGWFPEYYKLWQVPNEDGGFSFSLPSWSNLKIFPGGRDDPKIKREEAIASPEWFMERYAAIPCPPSGLVFREFTNKYHVSLDARFNPEFPVYLWIDPGYYGAYAVEAVQIRGDTIYVIDEIYERGFVTEDIISSCMQRQWWYKVEGGAVDIYALRHQAMPAVVQVWEAAPARLRLTAQMVKEEEGRERLHNFLRINPLTGRPGIIINPKCAGLISEFGGCRSPVAEGGAYKWKIDRDGAIIGKSPDDKNNHAIKAMTYGVVDKFGIAHRGEMKVKSWHYRGSAYG